MEAFCEHVLLPKKQAKTNFNNRPDSLVVEKS